MDHSLTQTQLNSTVSMSEEAISYIERMITNLRKGPPPGHYTLKKLAHTFYDRYKLLGSMEDLEEAITYYREELTLCPTGHPDRFMSLVCLAVAVHDRYKQLGRMKDLEEVITYTCESLSLCPIGHPHRYMSLSCLANAVLDRYKQLGSMEDLEEAITYHRESLNLHPIGHPDRYMSLNNLANAVLVRYKLLGSTEDLEEAITYYHEELTLCPTGHSDRSISLNNLANAVLLRYRQLGGMKDLEEVIKYNCESLSLRPIGHPDRYMSLNNLGNAVHTRYELLGSMEDLEEAITYHREGLTLCPTGHPDRSSSLNNLAISIFDRYKQLGRMKDLEEAITYNSESLSLCPIGHPGRCMPLNNLANAVRTRYELLGSMEDLEEAITYYREGLTLCPIGHPVRSMSLSNLSNAVHTRYEQLGRIKDLQEVITYHHEALTLCPPGHPNRSFSLDNLAHAVYSRYELWASMEDLDEAITYYREGLILRPTGHPLRSVSLDHLAIAVVTRYKQLGSNEDFEEAITYHREALILRPPGQPDRYKSLSNLASTIFAHFKQSGSLRMKDLDDVIMYYSESLNLLPIGHAGRSITLTNLADAVLVRYEQSGRMQDYEESFSLYEQAVNDLAASSIHRLRTAIYWAQRAQFYHHNSVIRAYSMSLYLLNYFLIFYPDIDSQQKILAFLATAPIPKSLASNAASAAIDAEDLEAAVELLEQGRAILWSKMKGYRNPLDSLRQVNGQLADALKKIHVQLEQLALSLESRVIDGNMPTGRPNLEIQMQRNRILTAEWEKIIRQIREIDGFHNFLQAVPFRTLQKAAAEGPVILINISYHHSDAIIIHIDKPPTLVTLPSPNVHPGHLTHLGQQLALARQRDTPQAERSTIISSILRDLWNNIVFPVCKCLQQLGVSRQSRVWWCPTSELCALPLHAAGLYEPKKRTSNLPDILTSSYTPTLSALISARSNTVIGQSISPKLLVIGQPESPDTKSLAKVQDEVNDIQQLGDFVDVLVGVKASREAVLHSLQQHSWAHFACHGHLGDNLPFHASFELHDEDHLTLLDLMQAKLPNAEFAFLSSCHSAEGDPITSDETIHLAAAMQFCGFRSVVGTMWEMSDKAGPIVSKAFYNYMFRNPGNKADIRDSAKALSMATSELRKQGAPLDCWIVLVHIGI